MCAVDIIVRSDLTSEQYRDRIAELIREIEEEGENKRCGYRVAGVEKILSQNPFEPPTRQTKRSPRPLFHVASREARDDLKNGFAEFQAQYRVASVPGGLLPSGTAVHWTAAPETATGAADPVDQCPRLGCRRTW